MGNVWRALHHPTEVAAGPIARQPDVECNIHLNQYEAEDLLEGALMHLNNLVEGLVVIINHQRMTDQAHAELMAQVHVIQEYITEVMVDVDHVTIDTNVN